MFVAAAGTFGVLAGVVAGYFFRGREWLRDKRLDIYSEFIASFLGLVESSMNVVSLYTSFGDKMLTNPEWREASLPALTEAAAQRNAFDLATAKVHLVSDASTFEAATTVETFVLERISKLPPYHAESENPFQGFGTLREDAASALGEFLRSASRHAGVRPRGAKAGGLGLLATKRES